MNQYLEKIAKQTERKNGLAKDVASVGAGAHLLSKVPQRLLGYHKIYHGTTNENAVSIRKNGFDPSKGGTGASVLSGHYQEQSKGKIHVTKTKPAARLYAGGFEKKWQAAKDLQESSSDPKPSLSKTLLKSMKDSYTGKGSVVKARVPHSTWSKMKVDEDSSRGAPKNSFIQERMKERAATTHRKIDKKFIVGKGSGSIGGYATKKNIKRYLSTGSGRMRALGGVGQLAAGSALIANTVNNHRKDRE